MSKRLGKDLRNKFIAEFEQDGKLSDPNYYAIKDKNGKVQIRRHKEKKEKTSEESPSEETVTPAPEEKPAAPAKPKKEKTL